jgi:hypothetical protein
MNNEENHGFTSFDFITMMISFAVIAAVTGPIIKKNIQSDQSLDQARVETSQLGRSLVNPANLTKLVSDNDNPFKKGRAVASVDRKDSGPKLDLESIRSHLKSGEWEGNIGRDPWGNPYHFSFLKNSKGATTHVAVWSDGPNHVSETSVRGQLARPDRPDLIEFKGDDLGSVIPLR